jgi:serine protease inhibitor
MNHLLMLFAFAGILSMMFGCASAVDPLVKNQVDPVADVAEVAQVAQGNNAFAFDLYSKVCAKEGNLFFSPESISTALAMTYGGAKGNTAEEMATVMHFTLGQEKLHPAFAALLKTQNGAGVDPASRGYQLVVANALWGQAGYPWKADFLKKTETNYGAGLRQLDFSASEQARQTINSWVEKETREKIKDLIPSGVLTSLTRLVLTNAIYFKGDWAAQFDKKDTHDNKFFLTADKTVTAPMMHRKGDYRMFENDDLQMLELPYKGKDLSMLVLLPRKTAGLGELEKHLSAATFDEFIKNLRDRHEVDVAFPKFKIDVDQPLTNVLQEMGMRDAFKLGNADFSGMAETEDLFIAAVLHKAFVEVNEEGTEAAAATGVVIAARAASIAPTFRADHPFVFAIRDNRSGSILFIGRMADPSAK